MALAQPGTPASAGPGGESRIPSPPRSASKSCQICILRVQLSTRKFLNYIKEAINYRRRSLSHFNGSAPSSGSGDLFSAALGSAARLARLPPHALAFPPPAPLCPPVSPLHLWIPPLHPHPSPLSKGPSVVCGFVPIVPTPWPHPGAPAMLATPPPLIHHPQAPLPPWDPSSAQPWGGCPWPGPLPSAPRPWGPFWGAGAGVVGGGAGSPAGPGL